MVDWPDPSFGRISYVVTARHVIGEGACVLRLPGGDGSEIILEIPVEKWHESSEGDDLAVGYSGSPVFLYIPPMSVRGAIGGKDSGWLSQYRLIRIDVGHIREKIEVLDIDSKMTDPRMHVVSNMAIAIVVPTWKIVELINGPEASAERLALLT